MVCPDIFYRLAGFILNAALVTVTSHAEWTTRTYIRESKGCMGGEFFPFFLFLPSLNDP